MTEQKTETITSENLGKCPLNYGENRVFNEIGNFYIDFECNDCKAWGKEWYSVRFIQAKATRFVK